MAIGINDLDDDEDIMEGNLESDSTGLYSSDNTSGWYSGNNQEEDFVEDLLKTRGIDDPSKIKFEEDDGTVVERSWDNLTKEEKMNIIDTPLMMNNYYNNNNNLDGEEVELINQIRSSGLTPSQYLNQVYNEGTNYPTMLQQPSYKIEELSDDEIFLLDLESRVGELTDEEAADALNSAKLNETVYQKQVEGIRKEYREREDYENVLKLAEIEELQRQAYENYQANVVNAIDGFTSIGNLDVNFEDSDKEELAEFMLSRDENGQNYLYQALLDPQTLVKAAWFILNGEEAFNNVADYFKDLMKLISRNQYNKGFQDGKNGNFSRPDVYVDTTRNSNRQVKNYSSIEELDDDD